MVFCRGLLGGALLQLCSTVMVLVGALVSLKGGTGAPLLELLKNVATCYTHLASSREIEERF